MGKNERDRVQPHHFLNLVVPLSLPVAGFIFSTITRKSRTRNRASSNASNKDESLIMDSSELSSRGQEEAQREPVKVQCSKNMEGENESLKRLVSAMEDRAGEAESEFRDYRGATEKESLLPKLQMICLAFRLDCLEARNQRLEAVIADQQAAIETLKEMGAELKWLLGNEKKSAEVDELHLQARILGDREIELSKIEAELRQVKDADDQLQEEKKALDRKMNSLTAKHLSASKVTKLPILQIEGDDNTRMASIEELPDQQEQCMRRWYVEMVEGLACLRHELLMKQEEVEPVQKSMELPADDGAKGTEFHDPSPVAEPGHGVCLDAAEAARKKHSGSSQPADDIDHEACSDAAARKKPSGAKKTRSLFNFKSWAKGGTGKVFSFKLQGAYNMMVKLSREQLDRGVICSSARNHAQGVALSAQKLGCESGAQLRGWVQHLSSREIHMMKHSHTLSSVPSRNAAHSYTCLIILMLLQVKELLEWKLFTNRRLHFMQYL
ncbi:unnamed protein product [Musa acuminata var. zebrina]